MDQHAERVNSRIAPAIVEFCAVRGVGSQFHAEDLHRHVEIRTGRVAPASADRVLRMLRTGRQVEYKVLDRGRSLYEITAIAPLA